MRVGLAWVRIIEPFVSAYSPMPPSPNESLPSATSLHRRSRLQQGFVVLALIGVALLLGLVIAVAVVFPQLPDTSALSNDQPKQPLRV